MKVPTFSEKLAVRLLAREGISAVWQLHIAAATAYRDGYRRAAETVLEIADALRALGADRPVTASTTRSGQ